VTAPAVLAACGVLAVGGQLLSDRPYVPLVLLGGLMLVVSIALFWKAQARRQAIRAAERRRAVTRGYIR
jgi:hypothetical protein